jgi:ATP-dependent DNA helicase RecG
MTIEDVKTIIRGDETRTLEMKKTTGELKDGMRSACAFLNTAGGWLFFGIAPTTLKILGQEVTDNTRKEIAREIAKLEPLIDLPVEYIDVPDRPGYQVIAIHLDAPSYWDAPFTYDNKPYIRIESTTVVMPREIFEDRLMRSKSNRYKWEDHICEGITIADLEEQRIRGGVRLGVERGRMPESSLMETTESLVKKLKLTTNGKLKNAAAALFLRDTSQFPQFLLRMARFRGNDKMEFIDNQRAYGNFFTLLDAGMAFFFKHLSLSGKIVGFTREEKLEIPAEALREALTNALCHRMFHNTSSSVGIAIYDDRVEIENTGHLPDELTVETIKQSHHSYPQNPTIADVLFKTTFLENWGSGVGRMVDACKRANLPEPEFNQNAAFVWVTFKRATIQPYNHTSLPLNPTTPQVNTPSTPTTPTTSKREMAKVKHIKALLSAIGTNGSNLKALMESMQRKDRKGFVSTYIAPNIEAGYIAMLYPEAPNHPMQSYYLTKKGRELLEQL